MSSPLIRTSLSPANAELDLPAICSKSAPSTRTVRLLADVQGVVLLHVASCVAPGGDGVVAACRGPDVVGRRLVQVALSADREELAALSVLEQDLVVPAASGVEWVRIPLCVFFSGRRSGGRLAAL